MVCLYLYHVPRDRVRQAEDDYFRAMFDKDREMQEISQPQPKYRNDENVLGSKLSLSLQSHLITGFLSRILSPGVPADCDGGGGGGRQVLRD